MLLPTASEGRPVVSPSLDQSGLRDNHSRGTVADFLVSRIQPGSRLAIVSAYFTNYAYEALKDTLEQIDCLNFLFGGAAHIRPYARGGEHVVNNGLLLRGDLHTLFDNGYVTISPDLRVRISRRIREEFENVRDYYALEDRSIRTPDFQGFAPAREPLAWHNQNIFRP